MYALKEPFKVTLRRREAQMRNIRATHESKWSQIRDFMAPDRYRPALTDDNLGVRKDQNIIDNTPVKAARTLSSGMMAGITPPTRPWKRIGPANRDQAQNYAIKNYCYNADRVIDEFFQRGNLYKVLPHVFYDLGTFMTGAMLVERDEDHLLHFTHLPAGTWWGSTNKKGRIDTIYREFRYTVRQLIEEFGQVDANGELDMSNFSYQVQNFYKQKQLENIIDVAHWVIPNPNYRRKKIGLEGKKYLSYYYERGADYSASTGNTVADPSLTEDVFLEVAGYDWFPVLCPRWGVVGTDTYAVEGPGSLALGDAMALQRLHSRKFEAIDKQVRPPMSAPTYLKTQAHSTLPDKVTYLDLTNGGQKYEPIYQVKPDLSGMLATIQEHQQGINEAFYVDLFLLLTQRDRPDMTAREVEELHDEKLVMLGPVLTQVNQDLLDPLIEIAYEEGVLRGEFGVPPPDIQGEPLKIEYISIMAQAQKAVGISSIQDTVMFIGQLAQTSPEALDNLDVDQTVEEYIEARGTPPRMIRAADQVAQIRQNRQQQQAAAQAAQQIPQAAVAAKNLSQAQTDQPSLLQNLLSRANAGSLVPAA